MGYGIKKLQIGCVVEDDKVTALPEGYQLIVCVSVCVWVLTCVCVLPVSGGHRYPGGADHGLRGLRSVHGRRSFQQDLNEHHVNKKLFEHDRVCVVGLIHDGC